MLDYSKMTIRYLTLALFFLLPNVNGPALAQSNSFSIYFDLQKADMGDSAVKIVARIKQGIKKSSRVTIAGHCDTSEADPDTLSLTRAKAVQQTLAGMGIPGGTRVTVVGKGATDLKVPTGPNVADPHNRFVSVTIE